MNNNNLTLKIWGVFYPPILYQIIQGTVVYYGAAYTGYEFSPTFLLSFSAFLGIIIFGILYKRDSMKIQGSIGNKTMPVVSYKDYIYIIPLSVCSAFGFNKVVAIIMAFFPKSFLESFNEVSSALQTGDIFIQILATVIMAPVVEELIFRGLIYRRLKGLMKTKYAMFGSALIFGLIHMNIVQGIYAFIIGFIMVYIYEKYRSLWAPILYHMTANGAVLFLQVTKLKDVLYTDGGFILILMIVELIVTGAMLHLIHKKASLSRDASQEL